VNGWTRFTGDAIVTPQPAILKRVVPLASSDGGDVSLYDGRDASGRLVTKLTALANQPLAVELDVPCLGGIYIDIGSNMTSCLVVFELLNEPPGAE
jgi:hypothetical protein